jgi:hypothetical protein
MEQIMGTNVTGKFNSREDADAVVERLVQEYGVNRADISLQQRGQRTAPATSLPVRISPAANRAQAIAMMRL